MYHTGIKKDANRNEQKKKEPAMSSARIMVILMLITQALDAQRAVVIAPVADLVGEPLAGHAYIHSYQNIPLCGAQPNASTACPRIGQCLFNESVTIIKYRANEVFISVPNVFYITQTNKSPQTCYWTSKKNIMSLDQLKKKKIDLNKIPTPIQFLHPQQKNNQRIATLIVPWHDAKNKICYSAGTRFVVNKQNDTEIEVFILQPHSGKFQLGQIRATDCVVSSERDHAQQREIFIRILKTWAHQPDGFIPYVWGGSSFCKLSNASGSSQIKLGKNISAYAYDDFDYPIKTGFDCSGLICRAAQAAGMPYYYKNTHTLAYYLEKLEPIETLREGDLIWIPGHVMIVSDIANNLIIEARGYTNGFGKVHEIPIGQIFKDIDRFDQLVAAFHAHLPLERLDNAGNVVEKIKRLSILKLESMEKNAGASRNNMKHPILIKD